MDLEFQQGHAQPPIRSDYHRRLRLAGWAGIPGVAFMMFGGYGLGLVFLIASACIVAALAIGRISVDEAFVAYWVLVILEGPRFLKLVSRTVVTDDLIALAAPASASHRCPRCASTQLTGVGLCDRCVSVLVQLPHGSAALESRNDALISDNWYAQKCATRYPLVRHDVPAGRTRQVGRWSDAQDLWALRRAMRDLEISTGMAYAEIEDQQAIRWIHVSLRGHLARDAQPIELSRLVRIRLEDERVAEIWDYPRMPATINAAV